MLSRPRLWIIACCLLGVGLLSASVARADPFLDRFFPPEPTPVSPPRLALTLPPPPPKQPVGVSQHNEAVRMNNQGVEAMNRKDYRQAISSFERAAQLDPNEISILKNLIASLRAGGQAGRRVLDLSRMVMAMDPRDSGAAYAAGMTLIEQMKQPAEGIPYLTEACRRNPQDPRLAVALGSAWEKAGYPEQALAILREKAPQITDDPYPMYCLGNLLMARKEYSAAIRSLNSVLTVDREGYVHETLVRARFFSGDLQGLDQLGGAALRAFPGMINRKSLERMLFALVPHEFDLTEEVRVQITNPDAVQKFRFLLRFPPSIPNHQAVSIKAAGLEVRGKLLPTSWKGPDADGRYAFECPSSPGSKLVLRIQYRLTTEPWLGSRGPAFRGEFPSLAQLQQDDKLSVSDPRLEAVYQRLLKKPGNFLQNAFLAVGRGLTYKENFQDYPVEWAMQNPDGCDCTEFARVLAALCLKRGLAARVVTGFLVKEEFLGKETDIGHAWCEVNFGDRGWIPVDPTLGATMDWAYFGNLLSDQIVFDPLEPGRKTRIGVDFVSTSADVRVKIDNVYRIKLLR